MRQFSMPTRTPMEWAATIGEHSLLEVDAPTGGVAARWSAAVFPGHEVRWYFEARSRARWLLVVRDGMLRAGRVEGVLTEIEAADAGGIVVEDSREVRRARMWEEATRALRRGLRG